MLGRLRKISAFLFIPASVVYFLGFITISSYYARFGIVSFDILNSRFISAGIFLLFSLVIAITISWVVACKIYPRDAPLVARNSVQFKRKILGYLSLIFITNIVSQCLAAVFMVGKYVEPSSDEKLLFNDSLWDADPIYAYINKLDLHGAAVNYIVKATLYFGFYIYSIISLILLAVIVVSWIKKLDRQRNLDNSNTSSDHADDGQEENSSNDTERGTSTNDSRTIRVLSVYVETASVLLVIVISIYCTNKLLTNLFDFISLARFHLVSSGLIFSWLFVLEVSLCFLMIYFDIPGKGANLEVFIPKISDWGASQAIFLIAGIPIISSLVLFGSTIFPRIPYAIGGGQPREIEVSFNGREYDLSTGQLYTIGENSQFVFVVFVSSAGNQAIQINKSVINMVKTRAGSKKLLGTANRK